jgi:hypothetical protein
MMALINQFVMVFSTQQSDVPMLGELKMFENQVVKTNLFTSVGGSEQTTTKQALITSSYAIRRRHFNSRSYSKQCRQKYENHNEW